MRSANNPSQGISNDSTNQLVAIRFHEPSIPPYAAFPACSLEMKTPNGSRLVRLFFIGFILLFTMSVSGVEQTPEWTLSVSHIKGTFLIEAHIELQVTDVADAWTALTGYNKIAELVPNMKVSQILEQRAENHYVIHQVSREGFLFFRRSMELVMEVMESPKKTIEFTCIDGDFDIHEGAWTLEEKEGSCHIAYQSKTRPKKPPPPFFREAIVRKATRSNLDALVHAINQK